MLSKTVFPISSKQQRVIDGMFYTAKLKVYQHLISNLLEVSGLDDITGLGAPAQVIMKLDGYNPLAIGFMLTLPPIPEVVELLCSEIIHKTKKNIKERIKEASDERTRTSKNHTNYLDPKLLSMYQQVSESDTVLQSVWSDCCIVLLKQFSALGETEQLTSVVTRAERSLQGDLLADAGEWSSTGTRCRGLKLFNNIALRYWYVLTEINVEAVKKEIYNTPYDEALFDTLEDAISEVTIAHRAWVDAGKQPE